MKRHDELRKNMIRCDNFLGVSTRLKVATEINFMGYNDDDDDELFL